jgi:hypothetical protein
VNSSKHLIIHTLSQSYSIPISSPCLRVPCPIHTFQEPANYNFEYHVQDGPSGNDFGDQESRQGDVAQGKYFVLLPDGRRQVVEYVADNGGYKPKISYEQVSNGIGGGYGNGGYPSGGNGGYPSGGNGGYPSGGGNGGYQY